MNEHQVEQTLLDYLSQENPSHSDIEITNLALQQFENTNVLSDIYFFDMKYHQSGIEEKYKLVLKIGLGEDKSTAAIWQSEKEVMNALYESGYPVPRIFSFEPPSGSGRIEFLPIENSYSGNAAKTQ